jgi:asparagine synthase (glutamine-hydrolysing)
MCGVAGLVLPPGERVRRGDLEAMADALVHRGPDDDGVFTGPGRDAHIGLAHRRLSVLDLEGGAQPMASGDGAVQVVFNGQIFNHADLRQQLEAAGHIFVSDHSDTEVLVHGFREWGAELPRRLNGQFAFCAVDRESRRALLARDPMGQKPLYVATRAFFGEGFGGARPRLAFASELSSLAGLPGARREISAVGLSRYLCLDFVPDPDCIYSDVFKMPPGCLLELDLDADGDVSRDDVRSYWDIGFGRVPVPSEPSAQRALLLDTLEEAVRLRLNADVPLGVFLSGGIDSSLVTALAARHTEKLETFSIGFREKSFDESSHARAVSAHIGTSHHEELLDAEAMREVLPAIANHLAEPFADHSVVPTYLLSRFCREHVTVAVGGDGGDELFLGYPTFVAERMRPALLDKDSAWLDRGVRALLRGVGRLPVSHDNLSLDFKLRQFLSGAREPRALRRHQLFLTGTGPSALDELLTADARAALGRGTDAAFLPLDDLEREARQQGARDVFDVLAYGYAKTYLGAGVLQKVDRAAMSVSLEARAPMMDTRFVDLAFSFPSSAKLRGVTTKALLKRAARGLIPDAIIDRPKKGFGMPVAAWLAGPLRGVLEEVLFSRAVLDDGLLDPTRLRTLVDEHTSQRRNHRKILWALFMYAWWRNRVHPGVERRAA